VFSLISMLPSHWSIGDFTVLTERQKTVCEPTFCPINPKKYCHVPATVKQRHFMFPSDCMVFIWQGSLELLQSVLKRLLQHLVIPFCYLQLRRIGNTCICIHTAVAL